MSLVSPIQKLAGFLEEFQFEVLCRLHQPLEVIAKITYGDKVLLLSENQSKYIPLGGVPRLANPRVIPLEIFDVQSDSYLGEDGIVRFEGTYGRK